MESQVLHSTCDFIYFWCAWLQGKFENIDHFGSEGILLVYQHFFCYCNFANHETKEQFVLTANGDKT